MGPYFFYNKQMTLISLLTGNYISVIIMKEVSAFEEINLKMSESSYNKTWVVMQRKQQKKWNKLEWWHWVRNVKKWP